MNDIRVELLDHSPIEHAYRGLRVCTDTLHLVEDNEKNRSLLKHALLDEVPHNSVLKHVIYHFLIKGIPRSLLQELVRHQVGVAINVLSTRWALHKMLKEFDEINTCTEAEVYIRKYYFISNELEEMKHNSSVFYESWINARLEELIEMKRLRDKGYSNDKIKHLINENLRTNVFMTISALALRNLFNQRLYKSSWYVFSYLAKLIWATIADECPSHIILYEDIITRRLDNGA